MIKEISLGNVRIFDGMGWSFPLSPLTVFCGTNSAGKSTLLKVLLLLRQGQSISETSIPYPGKLQFVGSHVDLGDYKSFVSHNDIERDISIEITTESQMPVSYVKHLYSVNTDVKRETQDQVASMTSNPRVSYTLKSCFIFSTIRRDDHQDSLSTPDLAISNPQQSYLKSAIFEIIIQKESILTWKVEPATTKKKGYDLLIPQNYFKKFGLPPEVRIVIDHQEDNIKFPTILEGLFPQRLVAKTKVSKGQNKKQGQPQEIHWPLPRHILWATRDLQRHLEEIHYLGPLRSPAKRYYVAYLDANPNLDATGEFLPYLLKERSDIKVQNVRPGHDPVLKKESLPDALNFWLYYLRTGAYAPLSQDNDELVVSTKAEVLVEMRMKTVSGVESHALTDSGFGYSQVLPILVRGLVARQGHTILIEQPELHLNPALQVRLSEFFVAMVKAGKQILIETHSEHIVNALRVLSAEDSSGEISSKCLIYYISAKAGKPDVRELSIKPDGTVPDWPQDFFGEAISLSSRLLKAQKLHMKRQDKK